MDVQVVRFAETNFITPVGAGQHQKGDDMEEKLTMTVDEVAKALSLSRGKTYELCRQQVIPTLRLGRRLLIPKAALEKMLEQVGEPEDE